MVVGRGLCGWTGGVSTGVDQVGLRRSSTFIPPLMSPSITVAYSSDL